MRSEIVSRKLRQRNFYTVPGAGAQIGLGRSSSYRQAEPGGVIPAERHGKFLLVRKERWNRIRRRMLKTGH
jgi:hypothetical protein